MLILHHKPVERDDKLVAPEPELIESDHPFYQIDTASEAGQGPEVWIDLVHPTRVEELRVEQHLGLSLPTREDMAEIETSSRLYSEDHAAFMTADVVFFGGQSRLQTGQVTFVLQKSHLVTIRYIDPASFTIFADHAQRSPQMLSHSTSVFLSLLDVFIDRTADLIEKTAQNIDELSKAIFKRNRREPLEDVLIDLGRLQNDTAKIRDSLVSWSRLLAFAALIEPEHLGLDPQSGLEFRERVKTMAKDVVSLSDHSSYVTGNITFLLDAALGLINIQQNTIVKVISITSVIFMPLTLLASIYGMNFTHMPYLTAPWGFAAMMGVMLVLTLILLGWLKAIKWI